MWHANTVDDKFFEQLEEEDARMAARVRLAGCPHCEGRLDRADYPRKPRGGDLAAGGERLDRRIGLCCAREGCRRRATPPSVVFLGRRVYLGIAVLKASLAAAATRSSPPPPATIAITAISDGETMAMVVPGGATAGGATSPRHARGCGHRSRTRPTCLGHLSNDFPLGERGAMRRCDRRCVSWRRRRRDPSQMGLDS